MPKVSPARSSATVESANSISSSVNGASSAVFFSNRTSRSCSILEDGAKEKVPLPRNTAATVRPPIGVSRYSFPLASVKRATSRLQHEIAVRPPRHRAPGSGP